jgi:hypothetical protein
MCPVVVVTTSIGLNCVVTFILECPVYVHLKPPSLPTTTWGIHVTSDNNIIVGVIEPGDPFTPTDKSTRALLIFGMDGKQQHTYQYDSNKHRLFTRPRRITNIFVTSHMDSQGKQG